MSTRPATSPTLSERTSCTSMIRGPSTSHFCLAMVSPAKSSYIAFCPTHDISRFQIAQEISLDIDATSTFIVEGEQEGVRNGLVHPGHRTAVGNDQPHASSLRRCR